MVRRPLMVGSELGSSIVTRSGSFTIAVPSWSGRNIAQVGQTQEVNSMRSPSPHSRVGTRKVFREMIERALHSPSPHGRVGT